MTINPALNAAICRTLRAATFYLYARGFEALANASHKITVSALINTGSRLADADLLKPLNGEEKS